MPPLRKIADACRSYLRAYRAISVPNWGFGEQRDLLAAVQDLREAVETWKDRYESERRDHEATIEHYRRMADD